MEMIVDEFDHVHVRLSERNLRTLLTKLRDPESARTLVRRFPDGSTLVLKAELDTDHYGEREPGDVHPRHEALLGEVE